jgi:thiamine pyrophosphate-dependent acetolactate synthase large subunit-like protein
LYEQEIEEYEETPEELARKVKIVADAIRKAKHSVVYTGAGISTAAKLPGSFRSVQVRLTAR